MKLEKNDYREIASRIEEGANSIEYEKDGERLFLDCTFETDGYFEDDRENGTGAWVETSRRLDVTAAETADVDGNLSVASVDERLLESLIA